MSGSNVRASVQFSTVIAKSAIQRPANTTAYAAGDVLSNSDDAHFVFYGVSRPGSGDSGSISTARLTSNANQATKLDAELWLFRGDVAQIADGGVFAPTDIEMDDLFAIIPFPATGWRVGAPTIGAGGNAVCDVPVVGHAYKLINTTAYGQLVARSPYTPVTAELLTVELVVTLD